MPKTADNLYQSYEKFRQGLVWKEETTDDEKGRALSVLQQFVKFLVDNEWKSGISTRRDQFIMAAMSGLLASGGKNYDDGDRSYDDVAQNSVLFADAVIVEIDDTEPQA